MGGMEAEFGFNIRCVSCPGCGGALNRSACEGEEDGDTVKHAQGKRKGVTPSFHYGEANKAKLGLSLQIQRGGGGGVSQTETRGRKMRDSHSHS